MTNTYKAYANALSQFNEAGGSTIAKQFNVEKEPPVVQAQIIIQVCKSTSRIRKPWSVFEEAVLLVSAFAQLNKRNAQ